MQSLKGKSQIQALVVAESKRDESDVRKLCDALSCAKLSHSFSKLFVLSSKLHISVNLASFAFFKPALHFAKLIFFQAASKFLESGSFLRKLFLKSFLKKAFYLNFRLNNFK